jgi:hypothetical protein
MAKKKMKRRIIAVILKSKIVRLIHESFPTLKT